MVRRKKWINRLWRDKVLVLMCVPALVMVILFNYVPMSGLVLAFKKFDYSLGLYRSPWNGFENFRHLFLAGNTYWRITRNTVLYFLLFTAVGTICNVLLAIGINELAFKRSAKYLQSIMIMPTFISYIAVTYIVAAFLENKTGMINKFRVAIGQTPIKFYLEAQYWPFILTIVKIWKGTGYGSVLYLATLSGIDPNLYEAAALDGANARQKMWYITLPLLIPMVTIMTLLSLGSIMHSDTGLFYQVTKNTGALYKTTQVLDSYVLNSIMTNSNYGMTAATTFYQSLIGCIIVVGTNLIRRKVSPENALF